MNSRIMRSATVGRQVLMTGMVAVAASLIGSAAFAQSMGKPDDCLKIGGCPGTARPGGVELKPDAEDRVRSLRSLRPLAPKAPSAPAPAPAAADKSAQPAQPGTDSNSAAPK